MRPPQLLLDVDHLAYHQDQIGLDVPTLSRSVADVLIRQTPRHAALAHPKLSGKGGKAATKAMDAGTLLHLQLLGQGPVVEVIAGFDSWRTKDSRARRDEAAAAGLFPLLEHEYEPLAGLREAILKSLDEQFGGWKEYIDGFAPEATAVWEEDNGIICRSRHDLVRPGKSIDLKFCASAADHAVEKAIHNGSHALQDVVYVSGMNALWPEWAGRNELEFIFIEATMDSSKWKNSPSTHCCRAVGIDAPARSIAESEWQRAKKKWKECLSSGNWPSYPKEKLMIGVASWQMRQEMDKQIMEAGGSIDPDWSKEES